MKNIVIDARMVNHSGIGTYLRSVISVLTKKYDITLLGNKELFKSFTWFEEVKIIPCLSKIYSLAEQLELPHKIPQCDLFLSPHYNISLLPVKAKHRVVIIHDVYHLAYLKELPVHQKTYAKLMINSAARISQRVFTVSEFSRSEIIKFTGISEEKIRIVYFGIDLPETENVIDNESIDKVKRKYNLPENFLLYVGNIKPHKNLKSLLHALKILAKNNSQIKLVVAGKADGFITGDSESISLIQNDEVIKSAVVFAGYIENSDLPLIYKFATALIFPSFYEGAGLPPLEAMAYGCPVIASSAASIPEICGDAALFFNPDNVNDLANKIELVVNDKNLRMELIQKGIKNVRRFSRDAFAKKLIHEINDVLSD